MFFHKLLFLFFYPIIVSSDLRLVHFNTQWLFTDYNSEIDCPGKGCIWKNQKETDTHFLFISRIVNELKPNILNLCEVQGMNEMKQLVMATNTNYYPYLVNGTDTDTYQNNGLLTEFKPTILPYRINSRHSYPIKNSNCNFSGPITQTDIPKHFITEFHLYGFYITMISLHLPAIPLQPIQCAKREAQAQIVQKLILQNIKKGNEVIVVGDLNDFDNKILDKTNNIPNSIVLDILKGNEGTFKKKYTLLSIAEKIKKNDRHTESFDDNNFCKESMIDHILISPKLFQKIKNVFIYHKYIHNCTDTIDWRGYYNSDHDPVVVDFNFHNSSFL